MMFRAKALLEPSNQQSGLAPADLEYLVKLFGPSGFSATSADIQRAGRCTFGGAPLPCGIAYPVDTAQIQALVRWACTRGLRLHMVSCGRNWGYGDRCAGATGCLQVDLSRMRRIIDVNPTLAYAVVEPGVTQGQLSDYLAQHHPDLLMDATGAGPEASLIGNLAERGFGHSRYGDRALNCCNMELVLGSGEVIRTGMGAWQGSRTANVQLHGLGPALQGMFTQAALGIITSATIWLMPRPKYLVTAMVTLKRDEDFPALIEALRPLRLEGQLSSTMHCFNGLRLLGASSRFPYDRYDGTLSLDEAHPEGLAGLLKQNGLPAWACSASYGGPRAVVAAQIAALRRAVRRVPGARVYAMCGTTGRRLLWMLSLCKGLPGLRILHALLSKFNAIAELQEGHPHSGTLVGGHWRGRKAVGPDLDPLDSGSGMYWVSPLVPMTGEAVAEISALGRDIFHRYGFEYQVTFSFTSDRALCAITTIPFDRDSAEETRRAKSCHDDLVDSLAARGFFPYRASAPTMERLRNYAPQHWKLVAGLAQICDPQGALASGKWR